MCIKPIKTPQDFHQATQRAAFLIDDLWPNFISNQKSTDKSDELDVLTILMELYEKENWPRHYADPIQTIIYHMQHWGLRLMDFAYLIGSIKHAKDILEKKTPLTFPFIWKICKEWKIPAILLLKPYQLNTQKKD